MPNNLLGSFQQSVDVVGQIRKKNYNEYFILRFSHEFLWSRVVQKLLKMKIFLKNKVVFLKA